MLANLAAAMRQHPPPMLVTMGADHARNRRRELEELLDGRGHLVIGSISDLAALGHRAKKEPALAGVGEKAAS